MMARPMRWLSPIVVGALGCTIANPAFEGGEDGSTGASSSTDAPSSVGMTNPATTSEGADGTSSVDAGTESTGDTEAGSESTGGEPPLELEGTWWLCEHRPDTGFPPDDCAMVDDDGFKLGSDGHVSTVSWPEAPTDGCQSPPEQDHCFPANLPDPGPFEDQMWGQWSSLPPEPPFNSMVIAVEHEGCMGTLLLTSVPKRPFARLIPGDQLGCGLMNALEEPGLSPKGPWYVRRLPG
jgi:hypothetical protein